MRIRVPATSANLGPGFDTLGMALQLYNYFEAELSERMSVRVSTNSSEDLSELSPDPADNLLVKAYESYFRFRNIETIPSDLVIEVHIPLSRGLGSSSSAIVAGLFLANSICPDPLGKEELIPWAVELEGHPDNVLPALLGSVRCSLDNGRSFQLSWPLNWGIILVIPPNPLSTHDARKIMPGSYSQSEVVQNIRGISAWVHAVEHEDKELFRYALKSDTVHEPYRGRLIPEFKILKEIISAVDVIGVVISGSGSTMAVYTSDPDSHFKALSILKDKSSPLSHCKIVDIKIDMEGLKRV